MDAGRQAGHQPAALRIVSKDAGKRGASAERGNVGRGVSRSARNNLCRVVVEDQDRRLARHARELAVDELVDDEIAENGNAGAGKAVDEGQKAAGIHETVGVAAWLVSCGHGCRRIQETALMRLSVTAAAPWFEASTRSP